MERKTEERLLRRDDRLPLGLDDYLDGIPIDYRRVMEEAELVVDIGLSCVIEEP